MGFGDIEVEVLGTGTTREEGHRTSLTSGRSLHMNQRRMTDLVPIAIPIPESERVGKRAFKGGWATGRLVSVPVSVTTSTSTIMILVHAMRAHDGSGELQYPTSLPRSEPSSYEESAHSSYPRLRHKASCMVSR